MSRRVVNLGRFLSQAGIAVAVLRSGHALAEGELLAWAADRVARYRMPKRVLFWEALPKSGCGKITKEQIREELQARGCLEVGPEAEPSG